MSQSNDLWVNSSVDTTSGKDDNPGENPTPDDLIEFLCESLAILWKDWPKHMECTIFDDANRRFSLTGGCPHKPHDSVFVQVTSVHQFDKHLYAAAMECQGCRGLILGVARRNGTNNWSYETHYPLGTPDDSVD